MTDVTYLCFGQCVVARLDKLALFSLPDGASIFRYDCCAFWRHFVFPRCFFNEQLISLFP